MCTLHLMGEPYALLCAVMYPQPVALVQTLFPALPLVLWQERSGNKA